MSEGGYRVASGLAFLGLLAAVLLLIATGGLFSPTPWAIAVQVLALVLMVWARLTFGLRSFHATANPTAGGLVTTGPYRYWRHPIYAAILYIVAAGVASRPTPLHLGLGLAAAAFTGVRIACEEHLLVGMYPDYRDYSRTTKRLVPGIF